VRVPVRILRRPEILTRHLTPEESKPAT
jgi:hypothetical protein